MSPVCMGTRRKTDYLPFVQRMGRFHRPSFVLPPPPLPRREEMPAGSERTGPRAPQPGLFPPDTDFSPAGTRREPWPDRRGSRHSPQLFWVKPIGKPILHCLNCAIPSRYFVGPDIGCSDSRASFLKKARLEHSRRKGLRDKLSQSVIPQ